MTVQYGSLPFQQQIDFFLAKNPVPTQRWNDLQWEAHNTGFMVAGAMKADLLADLKASLAKIYQAGGTLNGFRKDFDKIVADHGWTNFTGSDTEEGIAWRTRVIYETNLRTSYQAGRWQQIQEGKTQRPYLIYKHSHAVITPRAEHLAWDGLIVPVDSAWVKTHYPPNGYGCQCTMFALSERDLTRLGKPIDPSIRSWEDPNTGRRYSLDPPDDGTYDWKDPKTGDWHTFPKGIQPFWDYAPGASLTSRVRTQIERKMAGLPADIAEQLRQHLSRSKTDGVRLNGVDKPITGLHDIKGLLTELAGLRPDWLPHGVKRVELGHIQGMIAATDSRGYFLLSSAEIQNADGQSGLTLVLSALRAIRREKPLLFAEEYALETLWHEIGHNRQAQPMHDTLPIGRRIVAEALHQTLARQTYPEFLTVLGVKPGHLQQIRREGLSYQRSAGTFNNLLLTLGAMDNDTLTLAPHLLDELIDIDRRAVWETMRDDLTSALSARYPAQSSLIAHTLKRLENRDYD